MGEEVVVIQQDYPIVFALVAAFIILGLVVMCVPKPRKRLENKEDE